jgi:hypothetical protein
MLLMMRDFIRDGRRATAPRWCSGADPAVSRIDRAWIVASVMT